MENNNLLNSSNGTYRREEFVIDLSNTGIEEDKRKTLGIHIKERLKPTSRCCIYGIPTKLRNVNQEAYTPQFISIGPFHYGKPELVNMEKQKIRYKEDFGKRIKITEEQEWQRFINFIQEKEQDIRDCYAETFHLQHREFIIMILYDAIFIIELFLKSFEENNDDFLLNNKSLKAGIKLDLQLLENQLPFFVLKGLFRLAFSLARPFVNYMIEFFGVNHNPGEFEHFVDFRRNALVKSLPQPKKGRINDLPSAVKLHESGVQFNKINDDSLLNIKFQEGFMPCFTEDVLQIPHIVIGDETEIWFRNMMALEQCHYPSQTHICNYIHLMDALINSEKDVDLLVEKGIITNLLGDHTEIAKMFNKLCRHIARSDSCYTDTVEDLKTHHKRRWNRTKATLMSVYFSNLWRGTGTVAASVLLVLTLLQTIDSLWL